MLNSGQNQALDGSIPIVYPGLSMRNSPFGAMKKTAKPKKVASTGRTYPVRVPQASGHSSNRFAVELERAKQRGEISAKLSSLDHLRLAIWVTALDEARAAPWPSSWKYDFKIHDLSTFVDCSPDCSPEKHVLPQEELFPVDKSRNPAEVRAWLWSQARAHCARVAERFQGTSAEGKNAQAFQRARTLLGTHLRAFESSVSKIGREPYLSTAITGADGQSQFSGRVHVKDLLAGLKEAAELDAKMGITSRKNDMVQRIIAHVLNPFSLQAALEDEDSGSHRPTFIRTLQHWQDPRTAGRQTLVRTVVVMSFLVGTFPQMADSRTVKDAFRRQERTVRGALKSARSRKL